VLLPTFLTTIAAQSGTLTTSPDEAVPPSLLLAGALVILTGLACDGFLLRRFVGKTEWKAPEPAWTLRHLAAAAGILLVLLVASNVFYLLFSCATGTPLNGLMLLIISTEIILRILLFALFILFCRRRAINLPASLGLTALPQTSALRWGLVFGLASIPPVAAIQFAIEQICNRLGIEIHEQDITNIFTHTGSTPLVIMLAVFAVIVAPVFEELLFRGFAYPILKRRCGKIPALLIVGVVFALIHWHWPSFLALTLLGIGFGIAYEMTGSLLVPITMHATFNAIMVGKIFFDRLAQ